MSFSSALTRRKSPKKILIIAMRQIGDTLITSPLITKAHETWPEAKIDFLGFKNSLGILAGHPHIHKWIGASCRPDHREYWALFKRLFRHYDLALVTQPSDRSHLFGLFAAKKRFGVILQEDKQRWWKRLLCRHVVDVDYINQHVVTEKLMLIPNVPNSKNGAITIRAPNCAPLPNDIEDLINNTKKRIIVMHATPLRAYKQILTTTWHDIINQLAQDYFIFLTGSNSLNDKNINRDILSGVDPNYLKHVNDISGQLNFSQTATLLYQASLYIGVDTSVSHLAAACQTKSIVLFGPTPPTNFGPWPNGFDLPQPYELKNPKQTRGAITILQGPRACVPCRKAGCKNNSDSGSDCLYQITAQTILLAVSEALCSKSNN